MQQSRTLLRTTLLALTTASLLLPVPSLSAQDRGTILGRVVTGEGFAATDAEVWLVEIDLRTQVDDQGRFRFEGLAPGSYLVQVTSPRWGRSVDRLTAQPGTGDEVTIALEPLRELDEIVVSASPRALRGFEAAQPLSVVSGSDLTTGAASSLGETLADEPGVSSSYFGPGSSRPIIRGLGGDRVRVLEGGVGAGDASSTSPDHAVSIEPRSAQRIEIVRGPSTLLYGSSAIGGVVNVIDRRIPSQRSSQLASGYVEGLLGTVSDETTGAFDLTMGTGSVAVHFGGLKRNTDDYAIPGFADVDSRPGSDRSDPQNPQTFGILENSFVETSRADVGASLLGENGYVGVSYGGLDTRYGVPGPSDVAPGGEDGGVSIDLDSRRFDMEGVWRRSGDFLNGIKARFGLTDYRHLEIEGRDVATTFLNDSWEGRVEIAHELGSVGGAVGAQLSSRDFEAIGTEAFVPSTATQRVGLFLFQEAEVGAVRAQFGARVETQTTSSLESASDTDFTGFSGSLGLNWTGDDRLGLGISVARSAKFPTAEELFSDGPHLSTGAFELGNPDLDQESALSVDATARLREGRLTGAFTVFLNRFDSFIFQAELVEERDGLRTFAFQQEDATFLGYEAEAELEIFHRENHHVALQAFSDYVRAQLIRSEEPLPRIPSLSVGVGALYDGGRLHVHTAVRRTARQTRVAQLEEETEGYTLVDASASYRLFSGRLIHEVILTGTNLTDIEARSHVSFLKRVAPFPGREVQLIYRLSF